MAVTPEDMEVAKQLSIANTQVTELTKRLSDALLMQAKLREAYQLIIRRDQGYDD